MSILMALLFLIAGVFCIQRPRHIAAWIGLLFKSAGNNEPPAWLQSGGVIFFIRLMGFLSLLNAAMYFYLASNTPAIGP